MRVAVADATGCSGGELLLSHPFVETTAGSRAGSRFGDAQPNLPPAERTVQDTSAEIPACHDVVFLALPHRASGTLTTALHPETVVTNCRADFRLTDAVAWQQFYGSPYARNWPYGLPGQRNKPGGLMSSGASGVTPHALDFQAELNETCGDLALQMLSDPETAAHEITITVTHAPNEDEAVEGRHAIARGNLFNCAIVSSDPNCGRVLATIGTTSATFEPDRLDVSFNGVQICRDGQITRSRSLVDLSVRKEQVDVAHAGPRLATVWTNDLTYDYVRENAEHST